MTSSVSLSRLASDLELNKQGTQALVLEAIYKAELRKNNSPVNIVEIWQSLAYSSNFHSVKFKVALLDLYKQGDVFADENLSYFSTDQNILRGPQNNNASPYQRCSDLIARRFPTYRLDQVYRILPSEQTDVLNY